MLFYYIAFFLIVGVKEQIPNATYTGETEKIREAEIENYKTEINQIKLFSKDIHHVRLKQIIKLIETQ